jgi:uncharacterized Zn finger protein
MTRIKKFDFSKCPWCGEPYDDPLVTKVIADVGSLSVRCSACGTVYRVEKVVSWRAVRLIGSKTASVCLPNG